MAKILDVAQYIISWYKDRTNEDIDELKLHKLLYFSQREQLAITDIPLFNEPLEGWVHGPVSPEVRSHFEKEVGILYPTEEISDKEKAVIETVMLEFSPLASWRLRELSHNEISWINSRKGLTPKDRGNKIISLDDIRTDARKVTYSDELYSLFYTPNEETIEAMNEDLSDVKGYDNIDDLFEELLS